MNIEDLNITQKYTITDGKNILITPLTQEHYDKSKLFFVNIPKDFRLYLRSDVTNSKHISKRINESDSGEIIRRVAEDENFIVADYSLEVSTRLWKYGEAYLRILMFPKYNETDLRFKLSEDIVRITKGLGLHRLIVKIMSPQEKMQEIYESLGFKVTGILFDYVKDQAGKDQDFVVLLASINDIKIN